MKHKLCREMVYVAYSMINAYYHESKRVFRIRRGSLHHRYVVNRYDIEVYGKKEDLEALRTWLISKLEAGGYVKTERTSWKKEVDGRQLYFNLDEVLSDMYGHPVTPVLRLNPFAF